MLRAKVLLCNADNGLRGVGTIFRYAYEIKENSGRWDVVLQRIEFEKVVNKRGKILDYNIISKETFENLTFNSIVIADECGETLCGMWNERHQKESHYGHTNTIRY